MHLGSVRTGSERVPRLAPGCDPTGLSLSTAEGYLLSRVDGSTSWAVLRQMGGLSPEDVDRCLEAWLKEGLIELESQTRPPRTTRPEGGAATQPPAPASKDLLDPALDLPLEAQERILAFEARLSLPYHEILGVPRSADAKAVKRAYFELSKEYHPDRYFRKNLGPFEARLGRVFERIAEAYELLSDPTTRAEVERSLDAPATVERPAHEPAATPVEGVASSAQAARRARAALHPAQLRHLAQRRTRAKTFFEAGMTAFRSERWLEAAANVRLAIAFDPANQSYKESFGAVHRKASDERGRQLVREAVHALELRDHREALRLYEEALVHRPHDPEANYEAARLAWVLGEDLKRAKDYAARACELVPDNAVYRRTLGQVYRAAGLSANARRELEAALRLDPTDDAARAELRAL
jgi:curved DNA-binding protein CbpA